MPENTVYVGRPTKWGNPFKVGDKNEKGIVLKTVSMVVEEYRRLIESDTKFALEAQSELRGRNLACWCRIGETCHADVLLKIANR